jgi:hypothetical protein
LFGNECDHLTVKEAHAQGFQIPWDIYCKQESKQDFLSRVHHQGGETKSKAPKPQKKIFSGVFYFV